MVKAKKNNGFNCYPFSPNYGLEGKILVNVFKNPASNITKSRISIYFV